MQKFIDSKGGKATFNEVMDFMDGKVKLERKEEFELYDVTSNDRADRKTVTCALCFKDFDALTATQLAHPICWDCCMTKPEAAHLRIKDVMDSLTKDIKALREEFIHAISRM